MKRLIYLLGPALVLIGIWLITGPLSSGVRAPSFALLEIPAEAADKPAIIRSAHQLWAATPNHFEPVSCVKLMRRLTEALDDGEFRTVMAALTFAWGQHRSMVDVQPQLAELNALFVPRLCSLGTPEEIEKLIRAANENSADSTRINESLLASVRRPSEVPYVESRLAVIVGAALRCEDLTRAKKYLLEASHIEGLHEEVKASVSGMLTVVETCTHSLGDGVDFHRVVAAWQALSEQRFGRHAGRELLENSAQRVVRASFNNRAGAKTDQPMLESSDAPFADSFWDTIVRRFARTSRGQGDEVRIFGALAAAYGRKFMKPDYECNAWLLLTENGPDDPSKDPLWSLDFFKRALAAAPEDSIRVRAIRGMAENYLRSKTVLGARTEIEEALRRVKSEKEKAAFGPVLEDLKKKEAAERLKLAQIERETEVARVRGQLQFMKSELAKAKQQKKPLEDIASIERVVKDLERQASE